MLNFSEYLVAAAAFSGSKRSKKSGWKAELYATDGGPVLWISADFYATEAEAAAAAAQALRCDAGSPLAADLDIAVRGYFSIRD